MHKMSLNVHKNIAPKIIKGIRDDHNTRKSNNVGAKQRDRQNDISNTSNDTMSPKITVPDIERENSGKASLFSKGLNQEEIALELVFALVC